MRLSLLILIAFLTIDLHSQSLKDDIEYGVQIKRSGNKDSSTLYFLELLPKIEQADNDSLKALLFYHLHWNFAFQKIQDSTYKYFHLADSLSEYLIESQMYNLNIHMGNFHELKNDYKNAQKWYLKTDSIAIAKNHQCITCSMSLGNLYHALLDCNNAVPYYKKAYQYAKEKKSTYRVTQSIQGILKCAGDNWNIHPYKDYFSKLAEIILANDKINMNLQHASLYYGVSTEKLIYYLKETLKNNTNKSKTEGFNLDYRLKLMNILYQKKKYSEVLNYYLPKEYLMDSSSYYVALNTIELVMLSHVELGNLDSAYHFSQVLSKHKEKFNANNNKLAIDSLQLKYNYSVKEKEALEKTIALDKITRNRNLWVLTCSILGLSGAFFFYFKNRWKETLHKNQLEKLSNEHKVSSLVTMVQAQETERERIARDLHDTLGSILSLQKAEISSGSNKNTISNLVDKAAIEVRRISHNMMPTALESNDLISAIEDLVDSFNSKTNLNTRFHSNIKELHLSKEDSILIYRIIEELSNNVLKHAYANLIIIDIQESEEQLTINVEDDGKGFQNGVTEGFGLKGVRSRLSIIEGEMDIANYGEKGTSITITIPKKMINDK